MLLIFIRGQIGMVPYLYNCGMVGCKVLPPQDIHVLIPGPMIIALYSKDFVYD